MRRPGGVWEVMVPVTNEELALAFQQGDADAGEELLRNVEGLIRHQASKICRDGSLLEDLLQEGRAAALAAAALENHHPLALVAGNEAVTDKLL